MKKPLLVLKGLFWKLVWQICMMIAQGPYFISWRVVWVIVLIYFLVPTKHKEIARANFRVVFPQYSKKEIDRKVLESFRWFGLQTLLYMMLSGNNWFAKRRRRAIDGGIANPEIAVEALERAAEKGVAAIFATVHVAFWEEAAVKMRQFMNGKYPGMKFYVLAFFDPAREEINIFAKIRKLQGMSIISVSQFSPRTIIQRLREGHSIGMVVDQVRGPGKNQGKPVKLFGRIAFLPDSHFRIAQLTGAPVVLAFCLWEGRQFVLHLEEAIWVEKGRNPEEDEAFVQQALEKEARILERVILQNAGQWFCVTPIWEKFKNSQ